MIREPTPSEAQNLLAYLREIERIRALDNESLCRELLAAAPVFGRLGELVDIVADRLCPGIVERLDEPQPTEADLQAAADAMARSVPPSDPKTGGAHDGCGQAGEWLPIESAPKDNRSRLVWCPERLNTYMVTWREWNEDGDDLGFWSHFGTGGRLNETPTHWRPLPSPPSDPKTGGVRDE